MMDGNSNNENHGPEVMEWFQKEQNAKRNVSSGNVQTSKIIDARDRFGQKIKIPNIDLKKILIGTGVVVSIAAAANAAMSEISKKSVMRQGAKHCYEQLVAENIIPKDLKFEDIEYVGTVCTFQNIDNEKCERTASAVSDFVDNIVTDALDNGCSELELGTAFQYAGLSNPSVAHTFGKYSDKDEKAFLENIEEFKLSKYHEWKELENTKQGGRSI